MVDKENVQTAVDTDEYRALEAKHISPEMRQQVAEILVILAAFDWKQK